MSSSRPVNIFVKDVRQDILTGSCRWNTLKYPRPSFVSVSCKSEYSLDFNDGMSLNYTLLRKAVETVTKSLKNFIPSEDYMQQISDQICTSFGPHQVEVILHQPKANLYSTKVGHKSTYAKDRSLTSSASFASELHTECILGLNAVERLQKQPVSIAFEITPACSDEQLKNICDAVQEVICILSGSPL